MIKNRLKRLEAKQARLIAPGLALSLNRDKSFTIDGKHYSADKPWPASVIGVFPETITSVDEWERTQKGGTSDFLDGTNWNPETLQTLKKAKNE